MILILFLIFILLAINLFWYPETQLEKYKNDPDPKVEVYIFSWKKVNDNAVDIFKEVSKVFNNSYFIDCDETSSNNFSNIIKLDDSAYYGKQFETAIKHSSPNSIVGIIVGDIKQEVTDWEKVKNNMLDSFVNYDVGIYAPFETRTSWHKSEGQLNNTNYHITSNTDCSVWFLAPYIVPALKNIEIAKSNHLGWGIDKVLCKYSKYLGHHAIFDKSITVINPDGNNYSSEEARKQMNNFEKLVVDMKLVPHTLPSRKVHFISFADDNSKYKKSLERILHEAKSFDYFDTITAYTNNSPELSDFLQKHQTFISKHKRGYGYWIWKAYIVLTKLKEINNNDIILYVDAGCELNKEGKERLKQYIDLATVNDLVAFKLPYKEFQYTKGDILTQLQCQREDCYNTNQIMGGVFMVRKCDRMENFFRTLNDMCIKNNYSLVDDSPSKVPNKSGFIENRHDQSLFSVLIKTMLKNKVAILENEVDPHEPLNNDGYFIVDDQKRPFPIRASRK